MEELDWRVITAIESNSLDKLKVGDLKDYATKRGVPVKGVLKP
jgi:hypothetical protein